MTQIEACFFQAGVLRRLIAGALGLSLVLAIPGCGGGSQSGEQGGSGASSVGDSSSPSGEGGASNGPSDDERLEVGRALLAEDRLPEAMMIFDTVVQEHPEMARANFYKGLVLHERKLHASALDWYEAAADSDQDFPERTALPYYMAWGYYYSNKPVLAQEQIQMYLANSDDRADAHFLAGLIAFNDDKLDEAAISFRRSLELVEGKPEEERAMARAWIRLSDVLMQQNQLDEAYEAAKRATEIRPALSEAWFRQYTILMRLGREDDAEFARNRWKELRDTPNATGQSEP